MARLLPLHQFSSGTPCITFPSPNCFNLRLLFLCSSLRGLACFFPPRLCWSWSQAWSSPPPAPLPPWAQRAAHQFGVPPMHMGGSHLLPVLLAPLPLPSLRISPPSAAAPGLYPARNPPCLSNLAPPRLTRPYTRVPALPCGLFINIHRFRAGLSSLLFPPTPLSIYVYVRATVISSSQFEFHECSLLRHGYYSYSCGPRLLLRFHRLRPFRCHLWRDPVPRGLLCEALELSRRSSVLIVSPDDPHRVLCAVLAEFAVCRQALRGPVSVQVVSNHGWLLPLVSVRTHAYFHRLNP